MFKKIPFKPSKEWTANYVHLMRWGWYPGTTEVRLYKPSYESIWIANYNEDDGSPTLQEVINS